MKIRYQLMVVLLFLLILSGCSLYTATPLGYQYLDGPYNLRPSDAIRRAWEKFLDFRDERRLTDRRGRVRGNRLIVEREYNRILPRRRMTDLSVSTELVCQRLVIEAEEITIWESRIAIYVGTYRGACFFIPDSGTEDPEVLVTDERPDKVFNELASEWVKILRRYD